VPELIIIDYGDLLVGRNGPYRHHLESEISAFRDIKSLANKGYALWTASQAQRPKDGAEEKYELLKTRQIAGVYDKVRLLDFFGTLNQNIEEKQNNIMRLYAEIYRDNEAGGVLSVQADLSRMSIHEIVGMGVMPEIQGSDRAKRVRPRQRKAPL